MKELLKELGIEGHLAEQPYGVWPVTDYVDGKLVKDGAVKAKLLVKKSSAAVVNSMSGTYGLELKTVEKTMRRQWCK